MNYLYEMEFFRLCGEVLQELDIHWDTAPLTEDVWPHQESVRNATNTVIITSNQKCTFGISETYF